MNITDPFESAFRNLYSDVNLGGAACADGREMSKSASKASGPLKTQCGTPFSDTKTEYHIEKSPKLYV